MFRIRYDFTNRNHNSAEELNVRYLSEEYESIKTLLEQLDQRHSMLIANEGITSQIIEKTSDVATKIIKKLSKISVRLFSILRNTGEHIFSRYESILERWNKRIKNNISRIDESQFYQYRIAIPDYEVLKKRIEVLKNLHFLIDNLEHICDSPAHKDTNDWRVPEFSTAYKAMGEIGFDATSYDLLKREAPGYKKQKYKATIEAHGYHVAHLHELINGCEIVAKYASKQNIDIIHRKVVNYSDQLLKYELAIRTNDNMDDADKNERLQQIDMRIARLWWITHFINSIYKIAHDVVVDVLNLCKVAEKSMH